MHEHDKDPTLRKLCSSEILRKCAQKNIYVKKGEQHQGKTKEFKTIIYKKHFMAVFCPKGHFPPFCSTMCRRTVIMWQTLWRCVENINFKSKKS